MPSLLDCYQACATITSASNHPYGPALSLFPKHVRPHLQAVYAYGHIVEQMQSHEDAKKHLTSWRQSTKAALDGEESQSPTLLAFTHTLRHFDLDTKPLLEFLDAVIKGLKTTRYETYRGLQAHIDQTHGILGKLSAEILAGRQQKSLFSSGLALARAHRLLEIIVRASHDLEKRDVVYLPQRDLEKFGYKLKHLKDATLNDSWRELCESYLKKIEQQIAKAEKEAASFPPTSKLALDATHAYLAFLVGNIRRSGYQVFAKPPKLTWLQETKLILPYKLKAQLAEIRS